MNNENYIKYFLAYVVIRSVLFNIIGIVRSLFALRWNKTPAYLQHTNIQASIPMRGGRCYTVDIWYYYVVNDKTYSSQRFAFNYSDGPLSYVHRFTLWRLKKKKHLFARVNPKKPNEAVLFSGVNFFHIVNLFVPFVSGPTQVIEIELFKKIKNKFNRVNS